MSKLIKGIGKGFKKIFKGVKKIFKKITKSFLGKIILAALVIYTGGVLLGVWGAAGPMSGMFGAWSGGAAATTTAATTAGSTAGAAVTGAEVAGAAVTGAEVAGATATAAETAAALEGGAVIAGATPVATTAGTALSTAAETAAVLEAAPVVSETVLGSLWSGVKTAGAVAAKNPVLTGMLMQGVASAMTPDQPTEIDILREQDTLRRERWAGLGTFERTPRLSGRTPATLYQQSAAPWHAQGTKG